MKTFKQYLDEKGRCWTGYKPVPGKKPFSDDSCVKEDGMSVAGPTNVQSTGAIAGTGGAGGEPGVNKKRKPIMMSIKRKPI
jgi:hypothetical protein